MQEERREAEELEAMKSVHPAAFGACPPETPNLTLSTTTAVVFPLQPPPLPPAPPPI